MLAYFKVEKSLRERKKVVRDEGPVERGRGEGFFEREGN